jgi:hypothetical protein
MSESSDDPYGWRTSFFHPGAMDIPGAGELSLADAWLDSESSAGPLGTPQRYQKLSILGQGGMGRVWLGHDTQLDRSVAIKEPLAGKVVTQRYLREARLTARLDHAGVVAIYDVFTEEDRPHFVMALVRGQTLARRLVETPIEDRSSLLRHVLEVCEAVGHAHRKGIVHRDLSPRNVLIDEDGSARVIDWGLAVAVGEQAQGRAGTKGYVAPEQEESLPATPRCDVWSLGALLHTILSGGPPGEAALPSGVEPELRAIVECATALDPERRYADAIRMGADLRRWFEGRRVEAYQFTPWTLLRRIVRIYRVQIATTLAVIAAIGTALAYGVWATAKESKRARAAEDEATRRAGEIVRREAEAAMRHGDLWRARHSALESIAAHESPQARGVWMHAAMPTPPERVVQMPLPPCPRWHLALDNATVICQPHDRLLQGWRGKEQIWEQALLAIEVRVVDTEVHVLDNFRRLTVLERETGRVLRTDERQGHFATVLEGTQRLELERRGLHDGPDAPPDCTEGLTEAHQWGNELWMLCADGEIFVERNHDFERIPRATADKPALLARVEQQVWSGTRQGLIQPIDASAPSLDLGESLEVLFAIPGTSHLLAMGGAAVRVLDARRAEWIASFPDDVVQAHVAEEGVWLLRRSGVLERWRIPDQRLWRYRTGHGLAALAWSLDGARLAAVDGGGYFHLVEPPSGTIFAPLQFGRRVGKDVAVSPVDGDFRAVNMDATGMWRMVLDGSVIRGDLEIPYPASTSAIGMLASGAAYFVNYTSGFEVYEQGRFEGVLVDQDQLLHAVALAPGGARALLLGKEHIWTWQQGQEPEAMSWPPARVAALSETGRAVLVDADGQATIRNPDGSVYARWTMADSPVISVTWRRASSMVVSGHLDGSIRVWSDVGVLLAEMRHHAGRVSAVSSSPNGKFLAAASWDASLSIVSLEALDELLER